MQPCGYNSEEHRTGRYHLEYRVSDTRGHQLTGTIRLALFYCLLYFSRVPVRRTARELGFFFLCRLVQCLVQNPTMGLLHSRDGDIRSYLFPFLFGLYRLLNGIGIHGRVGKIQVRVGRVGRGF